MLRLLALEMLDFGPWADGRLLLERVLVYELDLTIPGCWPLFRPAFAGSCGIIGAESALVKLARTPET